MPAAAKQMQHWCGQEESSVAASSPRVWRSIELPMGLKAGQRAQDAVVWEVWVLVNINAILRRDRFQLEVKNRLSNIFEFKARSALWHLSHP